MIWKTFLISFMMNSSKYKHLMLLDSVQHISSGTKRLRSYSDDLDNSINNTSSVSFNKDNTFFSKPGYDNRHNDSDRDDEFILNITRFNEKMQLLKTLENKNLSQHVKLKLLENYNRDEIPSPIKPNIFAGGLLNDWNN
jgi:hypothetical protein